MIKRIAVGVLALWVVLAGPTPVHAQDIALTSRDGSVKIQGMFRSFDGEFYRVETEFGVLTVDASGVNCEGPACPDLQNFVATLRFSGDPWALNGLLRPLVSAFADQEGYTVERSGGEDTRLVLAEASSGAVVGEFVLIESSDSAAFADLTAERADVALTLREAAGDEVDEAKEAGVGNFRDPIRARVAALDALSPVVNPANTVRSLSLDQIAAVFSGEIGNWSEVGGADAPISLHLRVEDAATPETDLVGDTLSESALTYPTVDGVVAAVEADPYAIGLALISAGGDVDPVGLSGDCGFAASADSIDIKTEDYPLVRPIFVYTPARRLPKLGREFLGYLLSETAQDAIARTDFVDQSVERVPFRLQGRRFANAISQAGDEIGLAELQAATEVLQGAERMTLGFRFEGGSTRLDAQSRSNTRKLAEFLEAGLFDGKALSFVGFSDRDGSAPVNARLSKRRADAVLRAVLGAVGESFERERVTLTTHGLGEAMPLACDDTAWGRALNRRVEVWVRDQR
ncbi:phosphate ABC transporter substrate-binding/OmpA family protein [Celeribacter sp.]|uniref:phosphate ABC transporter substrate-binding/OmpA family protein n=1 Tax=Celeribacter sp. TaxID=1890673 RepID=UPI003A922811